MWSQSHGLYKAHNTEEKGLLFKTVMLDAKDDTMESDVFWLHS